MFRNNLIGATILAMSAAASAASDSSSPPADTASAGQPGTCTLDTERYVETKLDWRSYYLNRLDGPRYSGRSGTAAAAQSPVGKGS